MYTPEADSTMPNSPSTQKSARPGAMQKKPRRGTIQSVDRAARILKALASGPRRLGVSELADVAGAAEEARGARKL